MKKIEHQSSTTNWSGSIDRAFTEILTLIGSTIFGMGIGLGEVLRFAYRHYVRSIVVIIVYSSIIYYVVMNDYHLKSWLYFEPESFYWIRSLGYLSFRNYYHYMAITLIIFTPILAAVGFKWMLDKASDEKIFGLARLKNSEDQFPRVIHREKVDWCSTLYLIDPKGLGVGDFESKKDQLEGLFNRGIIKHIKRSENDLSKIELLFCRSSIPTKINYVDIERSSIENGHFLIGHSHNGVITQDIAELPHMLIAGMTGSGKSVFFKQVLMSLLESTENIKMYLIDLKSGLEMSDFQDSSKVSIIDNVEDAVDVLKEVKKEMLKRFSYLKKIRKKIIVPSRDKVPRIIIGIDECSVLYMKKRKGSAGYNHAITAKELTDDIAKLSRAAGIHLILATQKVTKETIDTSIQDNISGKVCFRMSGHQASILVLGNKKAEGLPRNPGRAIWHFGQDYIEFQAPYIDEKEIISLCSKGNIINFPSSADSKGKTTKLLKKDTGIKKDLKKNEKEVLKASFADSEEDDNGEDV